MVHLEMLIGRLRERRREKIFINTRRVTRLDARNLQLLL